MPVEYPAEGSKNPKNPQGGDQKGKKPAKLSKLPSRPPKKPIIDPKKAPTEVPPNPEEGPTDSTNSLDGPAPPRNSLSDPTNTTLPTAPTAGKSTKKPSKLKEITSQVAILDFSSPDDWTVGKSEKEIKQVLRDFLLSLPDATERGLDQH